VTVTVDLEVDPYDATDFMSGTALELLGILYEDQDRLQRMDDYLHGKHDDPYMPEQATPEYKLLAKRSVFNTCPLLVGTPAQALYVDNFRRGKGKDSTEAKEWEDWQRSRLDGRQAAIYRSALAYGHAFVLAERVAKSFGDDGEPTDYRYDVRGLSPLRTVAGYTDPAWDDAPQAALHVLKYPGGSVDSPTLGRARMWDGTYEYLVRFKNKDEIESVRIVDEHGLDECPVTRFAAAVDLEGRTVGVIEPIIELQNRINQTVFDLLVAQTFGSFKVRYATGMAPPYKKDANGEVLTDENGRPIPADINVHASRFLFGHKEGQKFGTLDGTPLDGYIAALEMGIRHLTAVTQTPPHHVLGQIANLSAEALVAAETALARKVEEFKSQFGESWERVFRLLAKLRGDESAADDYMGECIWRDMEAQAISKVADALGKLADQLGIPKRALWDRVPGVTKTELDEWDRLREEEPDAMLADAQRRGVGLREQPGSAGSGEGEIPAQPPSEFAA